MENNKVKQTIQRIGGYLHKVTSVVDGTGKVVHTVVAPFMVELKPKDILQIIVGATILAIPVGLTEETWILAKELRFRNVLALGVLSVFFIALFVYFNFYRFNLKGYVSQYIKRVIAIEADVIKGENKNIYLNGQMIHEPYVQHSRDEIVKKLDNFGPITVPEDALFVMGDNRDESFDSRFFGVVSLDKVEGKAICVQWSKKSDRNGSRIH